MSNESRITDYGSPITHHGLSKSRHHNPELERLGRYDRVPRILKEDNLSQLGKNEKRHQFSH